MQEAVDLVWVTGNNAVHPGQIDLKDDRIKAETMFSLMNRIAEKMISESKHIDNFCATLPEEVLKAIESRDSKP